MTQLRQIEHFIRGDKKHAVVACTTGSKISDSPSKSVLPTLGFQSDTALVPVDAVAW